MGNNIRTPKTAYFKHGLVSFYVKNKQIHYRVWVWSADGLNKFLFKDAKFEGITVDQIIADATSPSFTKGITE